MLGPQQLTQIYIKSESKGLSACEPSIQGTSLPDFHLRGCWWSSPCGYILQCLTKEGFADEGLPAGRRGYFKAHLWGIWCVNVFRLVSFWVYLLVWASTLCLVKLLCCTMGSLISQHPVLFMTVYMICVWRYDQRSLNISSLAFGKMHTRNRRWWWIHICMRMCSCDRKSVESCGKDACAMLPNLFQSCVLCKGDVMKC